MNAIAEFVNKTAEARAYVPDDFEEKKVTVRLDAHWVEQLDLVAGKLGFTRSGLGAELLARAIEEAAKVAENHPLLTEGLDPAIVARIGDAEETGEEPVFSDLIGKGKGKK